MLHFFTMNDNVKTALVTGASQGVGREISLILAGKGWDVIVVARSVDKLAALKKDILQDFPDRKVYECPCDLASSDGPEKIMDFCTQNSLTVDLLINNAGCGLFGESVELGDSVIPMLNLNVTALTRMCALFGKAMKERGLGSILNIGSIAGNQPSSYFASYAATKSYVFNYSLALRHELGQYGVNVTLVQPGYIRTAFDNQCGITSEKYKKFSYNNGMTARAVAKCAVKSVLAKRSYVRAGIRNKLIAFFCGMLPRNFLAWVMANSVRNMTKDSKPQVADTSKSN